MNEPVKIRADHSALELAGRHRERFCLPPDRIYLDGNSLGPLSTDVEEALAAAVESWRDRAVGGWLSGDAPWFTLAEDTAAAVAPLVGASSHEVIIANSTTVNLHQILATLYRPSGERNRILMDGLSFPSDSYAVESHLRLHGLDCDRHLVRVAPRDGYNVEDDDIVAAMADDTIAIAVLQAVYFTNGRLLDIARIARSARRHGVILALDCCHGVGIMPLNLVEWGVDCAFWCGYKYLNGGPGAAGGLFMSERIGKEPGLAGWFGSDKARQFEMQRSQVAAVGAGRFQIGTPNIFSIAVLKPAAGLIGSIGIAAVREASLILTDGLIRMIDEELTEHGFEIVTPRDPLRRGGHVALRHPQAERFIDALEPAGLIADFRHPDIIRLAPSPLYNTIDECIHAVGILRDTFAQSR